jgi:outer membrane lipopolysaccharide assembly protein LptE/RlpB
MEIAEVSKQLQAHDVVLHELLLVTNTKQAVINVAQLSRNAHVSAIESKMHAREAELHAQSAEIELKHLLKLCEGVGFDPFGLKMIKSLIKNAGSAVVEHELREIVEQDIREDSLAQNVAKAAGLQVPRT